jgi:hypothetical protein
VIGQDLSVKIADIVIIAYKHNFTGRIDGAPKLYVLERTLTPKNNEGFKKQGAEHHKKDFHFILLVQGATVAVRHIYSREYTEYGELFVTWLFVSCKSHRTTLFKVGGNRVDER